MVTVRLRCLKVSLESTSGLIPDGLVSQIRHFVGAAWYFATNRKVSPQIDVASLQHQLSEVQLSKNSTGRGGRSGWVEESRKNVTMPGSLKSATARIS